LENAMGICGEEDVFGVNLTGGRLRLLELWQGLGEAARWIKTGTLAGTVGSLEGLGVGDKLLVEGDQASEKLNMPKNAVPFKDIRPGLKI
jgi:hypothetical protein